jgi:hypothetical protein
MKPCIAALVLIMLLPLAGCGGRAPEASNRASAITPDLAATMAAMATDVVATITAEAAATQSAQPPATQTATATQAPTETPPPTDTPAPTATPAPTSPPQPTATSTVMPGLGDEIECPGQWRISPITAPDSSGIFAISPAKATYVRISLFVTNLQDKRTTPLSDDLELTGKADGKLLRYAPAFYEVVIPETYEKLADWYSNFPPMVRVQASAVFDVDNSAKNWTLRLITQNTGCEREIALYDTRASQAATNAVAGSDAIVTLSGNINLRTGPGTNYPVAGQGQGGQSMAVVGRLSNGSWFEVCCVAGQKVWVSKEVVTVTGDTSAVVVSTNIPAPPPTPKPAPTAVPLSTNTGIGSPEQRGGSWGLRLRDVKKAKTLDFYGSPAVASGVYLVPLVECRNYGNATAKADSIDFYLQDAAGRTFEYSDSADAIFGAGVRFHAGDISNDINPNSVLTIAVPWDVSDDLGDMWLRVRGAPNVALYLGNVSQLKTEN